MPQDSRDRYQPRQSPRRSYDSGHSAYEEALRRSNERISSVQRSARRMSDGQASLNYSEDDPRSRRYLQEEEWEAEPLPPRRSGRLTSESVVNSSPHGQYGDTQGAGSGTRSRQRSSQRKVIRIGDHLNNGTSGYSSGAGYGTSAGYGTGYGSGTGYGADYDDQPDLDEEQWDEQEESYVEQPRGIGQLSRKLFSRGKDNYREEQLASHSRNSGGYHARPATFPLSAPAPALSDRGFQIRIVLTVILVAVVVFSFTRIGGASSERESAEAAKQEQQTQLDTINSDNQSLQAQSESMQETIEKYNQLAASSS